ncbi:DUF4105 domain-containing protein [Pseudobacteriovorax antillogorgiicola]|uniref:Lnb N-terminal periplasmic domain-containing protein n=1 Tax=Pseudobacteriovorax antillogorgiicola TaxID=1513793 RepID=A0A1Y6BCD6_9BACT|nr:DUF4105 domain-containing protein [Pseudobacteriovorax antillogorgiicola]TCS58634.1 uncharacterized protein DUF4105 [Pseudobacteriovorax antillogorgiicola]SME96569.1 protein of unknown function [Pseudobacteriovorax antillogorgiicola]
MIGTWIVWLILFFGINQAAKAQESPPPNLDHIEVYLHTFDVGDMIYTNFGHTALRVKNTESGRDLIYNWGIFDFGDPLSFSLNYYQGNLIYKLGVYPAHQAMQRYRFEGRKVWQDKLNLNSDQKRILLNKLAWNALPENRDYLYQYFFDNCATRPRDFIDLAIGGRLAAATQEIPTNMTFRDMVRDGYRVNPWMDVILEVGMNSRIDRVVTRWESMFHPLYLREELQKINLDSGSLLGDGKLLIDAPDLEQPSYEVFKVLAAILLLPAILGLILIQRDSYRINQGKADRIGAWGMRLVGFAGVPLFFVGGVFGLLMPLNWIFSGHGDLHHNVNMMIFLPLDLVLVLPMKYLMFLGRPLQLGAKSYKIFRRYLILHLLLTLGMTISWAMGDVSQNLNRVAYLVPACLLLLGIMLNFGIQEKRGN